MFLVWFTREPPNTTNLKNMIQSHKKSFFLTLFILDKRGRVKVNSYKIGFYNNNNDAIYPPEFITSVL